jgi:hypothetical protein
MTLIIERMNFKNGRVLIIMLLGSFILITYKFYFSHFLNYKSEIIIFQERLNLGKIKLTEAKVGEFEFINNGKGKLVIYDVKPACGCTFAQWTKGPIKFHEKGTISFVFNANVIGEFSKSIKILTNSKAKEIDLQIFGEVIP